MDGDQATIPLKQFSAMRTHNTHWSLTPSCLDSVTFVATRIRSTRFRRRSFCQTKKSLPDVRGQSLVNDAVSFVCGLPVDPSQPYSQASAIFAILAAYISHHVDSPG